MTDYYRQLAEEGEDSYAATLGNLYLQGSRLVDQDLALAERFLRLAAKKAHVHSSARLGLLIAEGRIAGEPAEALKLLRYADGFRDLYGTLGLAYCAYKGFGVPLNESQAFESFRSIAGEYLISHSFIQWSHIRLSCNLSDSIAVESTGNRVTYRISC